MPRTYIPRQRGKRTHQAYSAQDLKACLDDVTSGKLSIRKAAGLHNIPRTTIKNKIDGSLPLDVNIPHCQKYNLQGY